MAAYEPVTVLNSATVTADSNVDFENDIGGRGFLALLRVSDNGGTTPTLDIKFQYLNGLSNTFVDIPGASFAQITTVTTDTSLVVYPGVAETANRSVSDVAGQAMRAVIDVGGTPNYTVRLVAFLIP